MFKEHLSVLLIDTSFLLISHSFLFLGGPIHGLGQRREAEGGRGGEHTFGLRSALRTKSN